MVSREKGNVKAMLAYIPLIGFIPAVVFLLTDKDKFVRFHSWQAILLFGAYYIVMLMLGYLPFLYVISNLLPMAMLILWIVLMVKTYQGEKIMLPYIGEIAAKQAK